MISRRDFARTAAATVVGAALLPHEGRPRADEPRANEPKPKPLPAAAQAEADLRVQQAVVRHNLKLTPAQHDDLVRMSRDLQRGLDELRAYPLEYGDEPAHQFRALRGHR